MNTNYCSRVTCFLVICSTVTWGRGHAVSNINLTNDSFTLNVTNNGPAVIDSDIVFTAQLVNVLDQLSTAPGSDDLVFYRWIDNTSNPSHPDQFTGGYSVNFTKTFTRFEVSSAGCYVMNVAAFLLDRNSTAPTNVSSFTSFTIFSLNEFVNVELTFSQASEKRRSSTAFKTRELVRASAHVTDLFSTAVFHYRWYVDGVEVHSSGASEYEVTCPVARAYTIGVLVNVTRNVTFEKQVHSVWRTSRLVTDRIIAMDPVTNVIIEPSAPLPIEKELIAYISCHGSSPFVIRWNMSGPAPNGTVHHGVVDTDVCHQGVWHHFDAPGEYQLSAAVENQLGFSEQSLIFTVHTPTPVTAVSPLVAVMCVAIAGLVAAAMAVAFYYVRHPATVETADFDFRSSFIESDNHRIASLMRKVKEKWLSWMVRREDFEMSRFNRREVANYDSVGGGNVRFC